jgi:prepilin-type N-terminal cleavage/methylation domain-containing protein
MTRRSARGFTLIELMIVVAIIGVLGSVALPEFGKMTLRARSAERRSIMSAISQAVSDATLTAGRIPASDGTPGEMAGDWNPGGAPGTVKRPVSMTGKGWNLLSMSIEGSTYYSYWFLAKDYDGAQQATLDILAHGDLDGDGTPSDKAISYLGFGNAYVIKSEVPLPGEEDATTF